MEILNLKDALQVAEVFKNLTLDGDNMEVRYMDILNYLPEISLMEMSKLLTIFDLAIGYDDPEKIIKTLTQFLINNNIYTLVQSYRQLGF